MYKRKMFQAPLFWADKDDRRRVAWHELFYDLFFVAIIFQLGHSIVKVQSVNELISFLIAFVAAWWVWAGLTHYYKRFETYGLEKRIGTFVLIIPTAGLAVYAPDMLYGNYIPFVVSYILAQLCLLFLWFMAGKYNPTFRPVANVIVSGFFIAIVLMVSSLFAPVALQRTLFFIALLIEVLTPLTTFKAQKKIVKSHSNSKLPERYGLFTLIVVGETVAGSVSIAQKTTGFDPETLVIAMLGIAIGFALWWIYHDFVARRYPHPRPIKAFLWGYVHLPMMIFLTFMGVALGRLSAFVNPTPESLQLTHIFMLVAVSGFLTTVAVLEFLLDRDDQEPSHPIISPMMKLLSATLVLWFGLALVAVHASTIIVFIFIIAFLLIQMTYSAYVWFNTPIKDENDFVGQVTRL